VCGFHELPLGRAPKNAIVGQEDFYHMERDILFAEVFPCPEQSPNPFLH
jgi:hypothetical protein